jgi:hypothetical protein
LRTNSTRLSPTGLAKPTEQTLIKKRGQLKKANPLHKTPQVGFEPTTNRLTADRSATELLRTVFLIITILRFIWQDTEAKLIDSAPFGNRDPYIEDHSLWMVNTYLRNLSPETFSWKLLRELQTYDKVCCNLLKKSVEFSTNGVISLRIYLRNNPLISL